MAVAPVAPTPKAEAATTYISTIMIDVANTVGGLFGSKFPFHTVAPNAPDIQAIMNSGGNGTGVIGIMDGAQAAGQAVTLLNSSHGNGAYQFALIRNPGRANGGFASRFDSLYSLIFGIFGGTTPAVSGNGITSGGYNSQVYDWGAGYDFFSDFPITPNPVSIANSLAQAFFPVNLIGAPIGPTTIINQSFGGNTCSSQVGGTCYTTLVPQYNALLYPLRFPQLIAPLIGLPSIDLPIIGNPFAALTTFANAYEQPLDILINIGYSDVVTAEGPNQWTRTFNQFGNNKQFLSEWLPIDAYVSAIGEAATIAFNNTVPMVEAVVENTVAFVQQAVTAIINFIQSIIGNFTGATTSAGLTQALSAATFSAEDTPAADQSSSASALAASTTDRPADKSGAPASADVGANCDSASVTKAPATPAGETTAAPDPVAAEADPAVTATVSDAPAAESDVAEIAAPHEDATTTAGTTLHEATTGADTGTAQDKLDDAAQQARDRAGAAATGAKDGTGTTEPQVTGTSTPTAPSGTAPGDTSASQTTGTSSSASDAAA